MSPPYAFVQFSSAELAAFLAKHPDRSLFYKEDKKRIRYFNSDDLYGMFAGTTSVNFFAAILPTTKQIAGLAKLQDSPHKGQEHITWLNYVSVDKQHRNKGIATELFNLAGRHLIANDRTLKESGYTLFGSNFLQPLIARFKEANPALKSIEGSPNHAPCATDLEELEWMEANIPNHKLKFPELHKEYMERISHPRKSPLDFAR